MKRSPRLVTALAIMTFACVASAQIYQWKDENGKTVISDKPPTSNNGNVAPARKVDSPATANAAAPQKTTADRDMEFRKRQKESQESNEKAAAEQAASEQNKNNCDAARRHLQTLESGERVAMRDDKGERYFLEDAQREQEISKTRQVIQTNCK